MALIRVVFACRRARPLALSARDQAAARRPGGPGPDYARLLRGRKVYE
ncbi:hypothetical protein [Hymenobacter sp.]|nr:hypothetical protein [Hymenobacter sp.]